MQIPIPSLPKDSICGLHGILEAATLLSRVIDYGGFRGTTQRHNKQRDATGRIAKWAIELLPFDITYKPCWAIKSQVLANFVAEWTEAELPKEYGTYSNWVMYFDGSKMLAGLGAGAVLTSPTGHVVQNVPKYYTQTPTMQPNMKPCCMDFGWLSPWAYNAWKCAGTQTSQNLK